jgi:hypothetical protein
MKTHAHSTTAHRIYHTIEIFEVDLGVWFQGFSDGFGEKAFVVGVERAA